MDCLLTRSGFVKLRSHLDKYLVADDDQVTIRQSRNGSTNKARWHIEPVDDQSNNNLVLLKSCHGRYLTASNTAFLLGMTGSKVILTESDDIKNNLLIHWKPIQDGFQVKLEAFDGTFLRANGGTPPWRNSVTHDRPYTGTTRNWILWDIEALKSTENEYSFDDNTSIVSSFSSISDRLSGLDDIGSPMLIQSRYSPMLSIKKNPQITPTGMELFTNAKAVRLRSHHRKYLHADDDEESVTQNRSGSSKTAKWTVELVDNVPENNIIRLKSCFGKYLTASNQPFLLGMTGNKVLQTRLSRLDSSVEWEPVREGNQVKLKTRYGQFLRANGLLPPWRNSVTHDIPHRSSTKDWILWDVDVIDIVLHSPAGKPPPPLIPQSDSFSSSESNSPSTHTTLSEAFSRQQSVESFISSPPKQGEGRIIYYQIAGEFGDINDDAEEHSIRFKGNRVDELTRKLEEEIGLDGIIVCSRNPVTGKLYQLRLQLPPNNMPMNIFVIVQSSVNGELESLQ